MVSARSSSGGGSDKISGGEKPAVGAKSEGAANPDAGAKLKSVKPEVAKPEGNATSESAEKPGAVAPPATAGAGKRNQKESSKAPWKSWSKDGWNKDGWNSKLNSQHQIHRHGYWNNGIWIVPVIVASNQSLAYLQPPNPMISGQKRLGVTHEPYDGGGSFITGVYEGSPAQASGLEVGDVIVSLDGVDATDLERVTEASNGTVVLQVLRGHTGELVQSQVNLMK